jgi:hypothetical protein
MALIESPLHEHAVFCQEFLIWEWTEAIGRGTVATLTRKVEPRLIVEPILEILAQNDLVGVGGALDGRFLSGVIYIVAQGHFIYSVA